MTPTRKQEIGVGLLLLLALLLLGYMALKIGALSGLGRDRVTAVVRLPDAGGLTVGALVKIAGVDVGTVDGMAVVDNQAELTLSIDETAQVRQDAIVQVRARSVLGEKYVAVLPQSMDAPLLADGGRLENVRGHTEIDELVNALGPLLAALDPVAVNKAMQAFSKALEEDPERASRMLKDAEIVLHNAAQASEGAPELVAEARDALASVRGAADQARPTLKKADRVMGQLEAGTADLPQTVSEANAAIADVRGFLTEGRGALSEGRTALSEGQVLLRVLSENAEDIEIIIDNIKEIDKWELRRLLREEGVKIRIRESKVEVPPEERRE